MDFKNLGPLQYKPIEESDINHFHLYKDGLQLPNIFRIGGLGGRFEDGYCVLIHYPNFNLKSKSNIGTSCIINMDGEIVLESRFLKWVYHIGGIIASNGEKDLYNLKTKELIVSNFNNYLVTTKYLFVNTYDKKVYKIDKYTGDIEIFE